MGPITHHFILIVGFSDINRHSAWHQWRSMPAAATYSGHSRSEIMLNLGLCASDDGILGSLSSNPVADGGSNHGSWGHGQALFVFRFYSGLRRNIGTFLVCDHVQFWIDVDLDILL